MTEALLARHTQRIHSLGKLEIHADGRFGRTGQRVDVEADIVIVDKVVSPVSQCPDDASAFLREHIEIERVATMEKRLGRVSRHSAADIGVRHVETHLRDVVAHARAKRVVHFDLVAATRGGRVHLGMEITFALERTP